MRISTAGIHAAALSGILNQQSQLAATQNQIASGKRIQTPADDPVGATHIAELQRALSASDQYSKNINTATNRLSLEEQALADADTTIQRVQELTVEANNSSLDPTARQSIATELTARGQELLEIANRRDANGEYLFAGFQKLTQPFAGSGATVTYSGDQGNRLLQISDSQKISDGDSGFDVFFKIAQGNGTFFTSSPNTNTGSGTITAGSVTNPQAWAPPDDYTLSFLTPTTYQIVDSTNAVVTSGTYTAGSAISFKGVQVNIDGAPATGDTFAINHSGSEDIFKTIGNVVTALGQPQGTDAQKAQFLTQIGASLTQLGQSENHLLNVRGAVGARLSSLDSADTARQNNDGELQKALSNLNDLDYASAVTKMNQQLLGLQAAQQSYSKIAQLSLFNYV